MTAPVPDGRWVGVHLADDYAVLAVADGTAQRVVPNAVGSLFTRGAVSVDRRNRIRVGQEAWEAASFGEGSRAVARIRERLALGTDGGFDFDGEAKMTAPELMAELLKSLKLDFSANTGTEMASALLTIPQGASEQMVSGLREAAVLVGLDRATFVAEPIAASYGVDLAAAGVALDSESTSTQWLVCQAENGSYAASVVRLDEGVVAVVAHAVRDSVNGDALTERLTLEHVAQAISIAPGGDVDLGAEEHAGARARCSFLVERAKREVWRLGTPSDIYAETLGLSVPADPLEFELTPSLLEEVEREELSAATELCVGVLAEAGLAADELTALLVVGTCAEDPYLQATLQKTFGIEPMVDPEPRTVIARGAAVLAGIRDAQTSSPVAAADSPEREPIAAAAVADDDPVKAEEVSAPTPPPVDPSRLRALRGEVREQRRRLLSLHERVESLPEEGDSPLTRGLTELVARRLYEQVDALFVAARDGGAEAASDLPSAISDLALALDDLEEV